MTGLGKAGIAAAVVLVIVAASIGGAMATPMIVDAIGAPPDSPLYGLKRLGERIRMASDEEQMKMRWEEYLQMVNKGKGLEYSVILEEFREKMKSVAPADAEAKKEVVQWMQEQMPGMGLVELKLANEFSIKSRKFMENAPGYMEALENVIKILKSLEEQYLNGTPELRENILARLRLIMEQLRMMVGHFKGQLSRELNRYFDIDNLLIDAGIDANIHAGGKWGPWGDNGRWRPSFENAAGVFSDRLVEFNARLAETQTKLQGTPENTPGRQAVESQIELAVKLRNNAIAENNAGNVEKAVLILKAAFAHLDCAGRLLDQVSEWRPEFPLSWVPWGRPDFPPQKSPREQLWQVPQGWG